MQSDHKMDSMLYETLKNYSKQLKKEKQMDTALDLYIEEYDDYTDDETPNYLKHTTREGQTMLIKEMDSSHLYNTIRLIIGKIKESKEILANPSSSFEDVVYGKKIDIERTKKQAQFQFLLLHKYILEANLRSLDIKELIDELAIIMGRVV